MEKSNSSLLFVELLVFENSWVYNIFLEKAKWNTSNVCFKDIMGGMVMFRFL